MLLRRAKKRTIAIVGYLAIMFSLCSAIGFAVSSQQPEYVAAAASGTISVTSSAGSHNISYSSNDAGTWSYTSSKLTGTVSPASSGGCSPTYSSQTTTCTIANPGDPIVLSFVATIKTNYGTYSVGGDAVTSGATITKTLKTNDTLSVSVASGSAKGETATLELSSFAWAAPPSVTITFEPAVNGTYTVDGTAITSTVSKTKLSSDPFVLAATPADEYSFLAWRDTASKNVLSTSFSDSLIFETSLTVSAYFYKAGGSTYKIGNDYFDDLDVANIIATTKENKTIVLAKDATLTNSTVLSTGVILLIPFDNNDTLYTTTPAVVYNSYNTPTAFRTLTIPDGVSLTLKGGSISCSSKLSAKGQFDTTSNKGHNGTPTGPGGRICMQGSSSISLYSGSNLYCWGYIYGSGNVTAYSGSKVYECFQIRDWRGGTATSNVYSYAFIFNQYYVQNIEVTLTIYSGAVENLYTSVNASSSAKPLSAEFIGPNGLFRLGSNSYIVKDYVESTDRICYDIYGDAALSSMVISGVPLIGSVDTSEYELHITSNMTVNVRSGTTTLEQDVKMLPSVELNVDDGATFSIASGKKLYAYDASDWKNFTGTAKLYPLDYTVAHGATTTDTAIRTAAGLVDAKIDVNGTLNVSGGIYTSVAGANITSSAATGKIVFVADAATGNKTVYEMADNSTRTTVTMNPARLCNDNDSSSYTPTQSAGKGTFILCPNDPLWYKIGTSDMTVSLDANGGAGTMTPTYPTGIDRKKHFDYTAPSCTFTKDRHRFLRWNTKSDGTGESYSPGATVHIIESTTLYAVWEQTIFTVTWKSQDGSEELDIDASVTKNARPSYDGATPTKAGNAQYSYTFEGWSKEPNKTSGSPVSLLPNVTKDVTYYATFSQSVNSYTITFQDEDGTELQSGTWEYGATPVYSGESPAKEADGHTSYTFNGWSPAISSVTGDATYTATYVSEIDSYFVTWMNYDGTETLDQIKIEYGERPVYRGGTPTRESTAQYSYDFAGWALSAGQTSGNPIDSLPDVTEEVTYYAAFSQSVNSYTITFQDEDGTELQSGTWEYGATPVYSGESPAKESTDQCTYTFTGWSPEIAAVTGEATYTAVYSTTINTYTVVWKNFDGSILETDYEVPYGTIPTYDGVTPSKANDGRTNYGFSGWDHEPTAVTGDATYIAQFNAFVMGIFWQADGSLVFYDETGNLLEGESVIAKYDEAIYHNLGDNEYYYVKNGVVQINTGFVIIGLDTYYFGENNYAYRGGTFYCSKGTSIWVAGWYSFDEQGRMIKTPIQIDEEGNALDFNGNVCLSGGLFTVENKYYYAKEDGHIATNEVCYVSNVNNLDVEQGLYYFDEEGHMWKISDGQFIEMEVSHS